MPFGPYEFMLDFATVSLLLFVSKIIRAKVPLVQNFFLSSAVIAGVLALALGPQFLNVLPFSSKISSYPYLLVVMLFSTLFLGKQEVQSPREIIKRVGDTFFWNLIAEVAQFGIALAFGAFVLTKLFPDLPQSFALMLPAGWAGGYGYATAIGGALQNYGFPDAITVGMAMATAGMLTGVFGGILMINIGTRMGVTRFTKTMAEVPESIRTGLNPEGQRGSIGQITVNPASLDPLAWHLMLILMATAVGYILNVYFAKLWPGVDVPMFCLSMLAGATIQAFLNLINMGQYVDGDVTSRIGSAATDFLVVFAIAAIKIAVVIKFLIPMLLLALLGLSICLFFLWWVGPRCFHNFWFERALWIWGWATGVVATSVLLLRIIDPDNKSGVMKDYGMAYFFIAFVEVAMVSLTPMAVGLGYLNQAVAVYAVATLVLVLVARRLGFWYKGDMKPLREGEQEAIDLVIEKT